MNQDKIRYFEYLLIRLLDWYEQQGCSSRQQNDLSILKSLKLLFFVSAVRSDVAAPNTNLLDRVFDDFWAMPYGHVELSIYNYIKQNDGHLNYVEIDDQKTRELQGFSALGLDPSLLAEIDASVYTLRKENPSLICMPAFALVDLSHTWYSWQSNYQAAQRKGSRRQPIEAEDIKSEDKIFSFLPF